MANHFVKPGGTGDGSTWAAAWSDTSINWGSGAGAVAAGDIIWLAGGSYGALIAAGKSGTSGNPITLRKVLPSDAVTSVFGYQTSFGMSVATFTSGALINNISWFTYDGQVGSKIGPVPYGFTVTGGLSNNNPQTLDNMTFKFMEFIGPYNPNNSSGFNDGVSLAPSTGGITNLLFNNCSVRGFAENLRASLWSNVTWEYCYLADCYDDLAEHVDMIYSYPSSNLTFRYNFFNNCPLDGLFHEFNGHTNNFYYGNIFYNCSLHQICYKNQQNDVPYTYGPGIFIYNNTFYLPSGDGFIGDGGGGGTGNSHFANWTGVVGTVQVRNNLFFGCDNQFAGSNSSYAPCVSTNNASNSTLETREVNSFVYALTPANIFVSIPPRVQGSSSTVAVVGAFPAATDFQLKATALATFQRGFSIAPVAGHTFDTDMNGNKQSGTWIVGALLPSGGGGVIAATVRVAGRATKTNIAEVFHDAKIVI